MRLLRRLHQPLLALALATAAGPAAAQDPNTPVGLAPAANPDDIVGRLAFSDTALDSVLQTLETLTGRIVIRPQALPSPQLTLNARQPLTRAEAILAIESLLSINGIGVVPFGEKFIKVVPIAGIRTEAPELVVGTLRDQPPSGKVVSKLFRLQFLDSASFQTQVQPFLSGFGTIVPFQNSNAVIVTDTVANLQRLEYVVSEVDRRVNIETKFYQINYAKASELAAQIKSMIESARSSTGSTGGRTIAAPGPGPLQQPQPQAPQAGAAGGVPLQVVFNSNTSITADDRTNQLIVIADPANLAFFDNMIEKLDVPAEAPTAIEVYYMKHAKAVDLAGLISQFVSGVSQSQGSGGSGGNAGRAQRGATFPNLVEQPGVEQATLRQRIQNAQQNQQTPQVQAMALAAASVAQDSQFSSLMTVIADERSNSIVVSGTNNDLALVGQIIDKLDILLAQVRIEVVIAEVTLDDGLTRGIDAFDIEYAESTGATTINLPGGLPSGTITGILQGGALTDITLDAVVGAARTRSNINLLSVPTLVTMHNQEATIIVGEARPIITSTQSGINTGGSQFNSFQFQDIGIDLTVTPTIGPNDIIQLEIDQKVDDIAGSVRIGENDQPIISRRQATSFVSVADGQLVVLGGLQRNFVSKRKSRMFLLGEIPVLGELFSNTRNTTTKTELMLFLKPTVLRTTADADGDARKNLRRLNPSEDDRKRLEELTGERLGADAPETTGDAGPRRRR